MVRRERGPPVHGLADRLQRYVDRLAGEGLAAQTIGLTVAPLRAIYARANRLGEVQVNPTRGLAMPSPRPPERRVASPAEVTAILAAAAPEDRALWATALYAGLRRVPIPAALRDHLLERKLAIGGDGRIFGTPAQVRRAVERGAAAMTAAGIEPLGIHDCRHTYASLMIAAGVNAKALSSYMGHGNIAITIDLYGHLMPGSHDEAAGLLDAFLARAAGAETDATYAAPQAVA